jgi:hypothetical protein
MVNARDEGVEIRANIKLVREGGELCRGRLGLKELWKGKNGDVSDSKR